jgi:hypothetical protein
MDERRVASSTVGPERETFETTSDQPGLLCGSKVMPPIWFGAMNQTGREVV